MYEPDPDEVTAALLLKICRSDRREVRPVRAWLLCNKGKLIGGKFKGIRSYTNSHLET